MGDDLLYASLKPTVCIHYAWVMTFLCASIMDTVCVQISYCLHPNKLLCASTKSFIKYHSIELINTSQILLWHTPYGLLTTKQINFSLNGALLRCELVSQILNVDISKNITYFGLLTHKYNNNSQNIMVIAL